MNIEILLDRSIEFQGAMDDSLSRHGFQVPLDDRQTLAASALGVSIEHATALRLCFPQGLPQSASALLRLQFEALVRAAWLLYAANDEAITLVKDGLTIEAEAGARKWPAAQSMLQALEGASPVGLFEPLRQFQSVAWQALNSYVHTGLHPLMRSAQGFPLPFAIQQIQCSNGLVHLAYRMLGSLTWRQEAHTEITALWMDYRDCLPPVVQSSER